MTAACASGVGSGIAGATRTGVSASFRDAARRGGGVSRLRRGRRVPVAPRAGLADFGVGDLGLGTSASPVVAAQTAAAAAPSAANRYAELFPDLPAFVFGVSVPDSARALADAASPVTGAALEALPDDARAGVLGFWSDEAASGFTLLTGNAEYELALAALLFLWATGRPGVFAGAFDAYVAAPLDKVLSDRAFDPASVRLGGRLGDGSFGQVFAATALATDADVVVKQAKSVQGAAQLQCAEEYMNRRVRRAPLAAIGCAKYLGSYDVVEGAASPTLVWAREGDATLEDLINARDYPGCLEEALYGAVSDSDDFARRTSRAAKCVLRRLLFTLSQLHDIGVVHRDVKPANLVLAEDEAAFKLVDFGAAADLRTGI
jgi:hypothetical protein